MRPERERLRLAEVAGWQSMKKGVLARWSRLKREQAERKDSPPLEEAAAGAPLPAASDAGADAQEEFNTVRLQDYPTSRPSPTSPTSRRSWRKASRRRSATKRSRSSGARTRCWPILDGLNDYDLDYRPSEIRALAARAAEDLARGTKWQTARDRDRKPPAQEPSAQEPPAEEPPTARSTLADGTPPDAPADGPPRRDRAS
jgi:hypothetical protein